MTRTDSAEQSLNRAIQTLSKTDPIVKLLQQVKVGRMQPTDAGLRVVTESWLATYRQVLETSRDLDRGALARLDPAPRIAALIEAGVVSPDHPAVTALEAVFQKAWAEAAW